MLRFGLATLVASVLFVPALTRAEVLCEDTFLGDDGEPFTVSVLIEEPEPGTEVRAFDPSCPTVFTVSGIASKRPRRDSTGHNGCSWEV